jgi:hypothetical protein
MNDDNGSSNHKRQPYYKCYYCDYSTEREDMYLRHGVVEHTYKPIYPNEVELQKYNLTPQGKPWEHFNMTVEEADERLRRWAEKRMTAVERKEKIKVKVNVS